MKCAVWKMFLAELTQILQSSYFDIQLNESMVVHEKTEREREKIIALELLYWYFSTSSLNYNKQIGLQGELGFKTNLCFKHFIQSSCLNNEVFLGFAGGKSIAQASPFIGHLHKAWCSSESTCWNQNMDGNENNHTFIVSYSATFNQNNDSTAMEKRFKIASDVKYDTM